MNLHNNPELTDQLAASYALGSMRGAARRRFEALAREHPALRSAALLWQERFSAWTEIQTEVQPHPNVWKRIALAVEAEQGQAMATQSPASQAQAPGAAAAPLPSRLVDEVRRSLRLWRYAAFASVLVACFAIWFAAPWRPVADMQYVAVLSDERQAPAMLVTYDARQQVLNIKRLGDYREAADRSLQLWAIAPGSAPKSLGVLGDGAVLQVPLASAGDMAAPVLAISLEPKGGVPSAGGPTGPVLFKGSVLATRS